MDKDRREDIFPSMGAELCYFEGCTAWLTGSSDYCFVHDKAESPKIYFDLKDWWIGYYRGDTHHYICPLPTLVIRWRHA